MILTRGGGSGATTAYDSEEVARAVCGCRVPVMVAVGHTSDRSLADECAFVSVPTPTAAAETLVSYVAAADEALTAEATAATGAARAVLARAGAALEAEGKAIEATGAQLASVMAARAEAAAGARRVRQLAMVTGAVLLVLAVVLAVVLAKGA